MFAGHGKSQSYFIPFFINHDAETTASSIITTMTYLALYPQEQEKAHLEVQNAFPRGLTSVSVDVWHV
jgi:hypothetical protein